MANFPQDYQNLFDPSKNYTKHLHYPGKLFTAAEANELQDTLDYKRQKLADLIIKEGDIVSGGSPVVKVGGEVIIPAGAVYVNKDIRHYPEQTFNIPTNVKLKLGVFLTEDIITSEEDSDLLDPSGSIAPGVTYASSGQETSQRLKESIVWGYVTSAGTRSQPNGTFYPSVDVDNGILILVGTVPVLAEVENLIVKYNNNVNGSYIIDGLGVRFDYEDTEDDLYFYTVDQGSASVLGRQVSRSTSQRVDFEKDPDTQEVNNDPFTITVGTQTFTAKITKGAANGSDLLPRAGVIAITSVKQGGTTYVPTTDYTLTGNSVNWGAGGAEPATGSSYDVTFTFQGALVEVDRGPINTVSASTCKLRTTQTLTRGVIANGTDPLPAGFIPAVSIVSIPGYTQGTDYVLSGSSVSWAPGGFEPTSGTTYNVTYIYNKDLLPDTGSVGFNTYTVASNQGASGTLETGTETNTNYTYNLKRIDLLELTENGQIRRIKGRPDYINPNQPEESSDSLAIASISYDFFNDPYVTPIGNKRVNQKEQHKMKLTQAWIIDTIAGLQLEIDSIKSGASTKGIFVDNFSDEDKQDAGKVNTTRTFNGLVTMPMTLTKDDLDNANNKSFQTLNYTLEDVIVQNSYSGAIKINPFATFTPTEPASIDVKLTQEVKDYIENLLTGAINPDPPSYLPLPGDPVPDPGTGLPKPPVTDPARASFEDIYRSVAAAKGKTELTAKGTAKLFGAVVNAGAAGVDLVNVKLGKHNTTINTVSATTTVSKKKG